MTASSIDAVVGGGLHVRLEGAGAPGARIVRAALGGLPLATGRPDLVLRVGRNVRPTGPAWRPLPAGIDTGGLWVTDHLGRAARLPLFVEEPVADCDGAIDASFLYVWVFLPLVRALLWRQGIVLVHAAGAVQGAERVAVAGWEGAGKSLVVLDALAHGSDLIGDDWIAVTPGGNVAAVSGLLNLHAAHATSVPRGHLGSPSARVAGAGARWAHGAAKRTAGFRPASVGLAHLSESLRKAGKVKANVTEIFPASTVAGPGPLTSLAVVVPEGAALPRTPADAAASLAACSLVEWRHCADLEALAAFAGQRPLRAPFPVAADEEKALARALAGVAITAVRGPLEVPTAQALRAQLAPPSGDGARATTGIAPASREPDVPVREAV